MTDQSTEPPTGVELTVTFCMPPGENEQSFDTAIALLEGVCDLAEKFGVVGIEIGHDRASPELAAKLKATFTAKQPYLKLVVDNTSHSET